MAKAKKTTALMQETESKLTYLEWQKQMLDAIISDIEEIEEIEDE